MGNKSDLSDHEMIIGARQVVFSISWGFSGTSVSSICREWCEKQKTSSEQQFCGQKCIVKESSEEKGQTGQSWQEGDSYANNHTLQQWYAEEHLWTHNSQTSTRLSE